MIFEGKKIIFLFLMIIYEKKTLKNRIKYKNKIKFILNYPKKIPK